MTVVLDDHLLRDWMARRDDALVDAVAGEAVATTNLWYARLCKSAAGATGGALLERFGETERRALIAALVALPNDIIVVSMRDLAWKMGKLVAVHAGLSALGAEAVAAATPSARAAFSSPRRTTVPASGGVAQSKTSGTTPCLADSVINIVSHRPRQLLPYQPEHPSGIDQDPALAITAPDRAR